MQPNLPANVAHCCQAMVAASSVVAHKPTAKHPGRKETTLVDTISDIHTQKGQPSQENELVPDMGDNDASTHSGGPLRAVDITKEAM